MDRHPPMPSPPGTASQRRRHQIHPRENGLFVPRLTVLGEQAWAHRRAFPRPRSSLRDSCWPLETPCGHPLASAPWQMVVPRLLSRGLPAMARCAYPVLFWEAFPSGWGQQSVYLFLAFTDTAHARTCILPFCVRETCEFPYHTTLALPDPGEPQRRQQMYRKGQVSLHLDSTKRLCSLDHPSSLLWDV